MAQVPKPFPSDCSNSPGAKWCEPSLNQSKVNDLNTQQEIADLKIRFLRKAQLQVCDFLRTPDRNSMCALKSIPYDPHAKPEDAPLSSPTMHLSATPRLYSPWIDQSPTTVDAISFAEREASTMKEDAKRPKEVDNISLILRWQRLAAFRSHSIQRTRPCIQSPQQTSRQLHSIFIESPAAKQTPGRRDMLPDQAERARGCIQLWRWAATSSARAKKRYAPIDD